MLENYKDIVKLKNKLSIFFSPFYIIFISMYLTVQGFDLFLEKDRQAWP